MLRFQGKKRGGELSVVEDALISVLEAQRRPISVSSRPARAIEAPCEEGWLESVFLESVVILLRHEHPGNTEVDMGILGRNATSRAHITTGKTQELKPYVH